MTARSILNLSGIVFDHPWMMHSRHAKGLTRRYENFYRSQLEGAEDPRAFVMGLPTTKAGVPMEVAGGIATMTISGPLLHETDEIEAECGILSYKDIDRAVTGAVSSNEIKAVLIEWNSPGGDCAGAFELAEKLHRLRGVKPIFGACNVRAYSAAYLLAAAVCDKIYVSPTAGVGSIGVIAQICNVVGFDQKMGFEYLTLFAGDRKNDGNPHEKFSKEMIESLQGEIDRLYGYFTDAVSRYRSIPLSAVVATQAAVFKGKDGVLARLADEFHDVGAKNGAEEALLALVDKRSPGSTRGARLAAATLPAVSAAAEQPPAEDPIEDEEEPVEELVPKNSGEAASAEPDEVAQAANPSIKGEQIMQDKPADAANNPTPAPVEAPPVAPAAVAPTEPLATHADVINLTAIGGFPEKASELAALVDGKFTMKQLRTKVMDMKREMEVTGIRSSVGPNAAVNEQHSQLEAAAKARAKDSGLTYEQEYARMLRENPKIYEALPKALPLQ